MVDLFKWFRKKFCKHRFAIEDLIITGIKELPAPETGGYDAWIEHFRIVNSCKHPSHTHRVYWACDKCGKVFYAHCGLDIIGTHGTMFRREDTNNEKKRARREEY